MGASPTEVNRGSPLFGNRAALGYLSRLKVRVRKSGEGFLPGAPHPQKPSPTLNGVDFLLSSSSSSSSMVASSSSSKVSSSSSPGSVSESLVEPLYVSIADVGTLEELESIDRKALVSLAARVGKARLIDNVVLPPGEGLV